jgi:cold shock CspA family protein
MGRKGARGAGLRERVAPSPVEELLKELTANRVTQGRVKFYNKDKGYGFIEQSGGDLFFHIENVENKTEPETGQLLKFERVPKNDGREKAVNISLVNGAEQGLDGLGL